VGPLGPLGPYPSKPRIYWGSTAILPGPTTGAALGPLGPFVHWKYLCLHSRAPGIPYVGTPETLDKQTGGWVQVAKFQSRYPGIHSGLMSDNFKHIDRRKRLDAEEGRNPALWILFRASVIRHNSKGLIKAYKKRHSGTHETGSSLALECMLADERRMRNKQVASLRLMARLPKLSLNTFILGFENLLPIPDRQARPRSSAPGSRAATTDSGGGGPDEPDPDPDPERPYIALGIDHKATTPAGPPVPVSLRLFSLYRIEMRYCHEGDQPDHPEP